MSLVSRLMPGRAPGSQAARAAANLEAAETRLAHAREAYDRVAYEAEEGGDDRAVRVAEAEILAARNDVERRQAALRGAQKAEAERTEAERKAREAESAKRIEKAVRDREVAAAKLAEAMLNLVVHYDALEATSIGLRQLVATDRRIDASIALQRLPDLYGRELARIAGGLAIPGIKKVAAVFDDPTRFLPLVDEVRAHSDVIRRALRG